MPGLASVDLEARVAALVDKHRPQLHQLVREAVDQELARLVELELRSRNGNGRRAEMVNGVGHLAETRVCISCGQERPIGKFDKGRRKVCSTCRSRRHEQRVREREQADREPPRPGDAGAAHEDPHEATGSP